MQRSLKETYSPLQKQSEKSQHACLTSGRMGIITCLHPLTLSNLLQGSKTQGKDISEAAGSLLCCPLNHSPLTPFVAELTRHNTSLEARGRRRISEHKITSSRQNSSQRHACELQSVQSSEVVHKKEITGICLEPSFAICP